MAKVTFELPQESLDQIVNDYGQMFGYHDTIEDAEGNPIPNPQSKLEFASNRIIQDVKQNCAQHQREKGYALVDAAVESRLSAVEVTVTVE